MEILIERRESIERLVRGTRRIITWHAAARPTTRMGWLARFVAFMAFLVVAIAWATFFIGGPGSIWPIVYMPFLVAIARGLWTPPPKRAKITATV